MSCGLHLSDAVLICAFVFVLPIASFTFYLAETDDREPTTASGSEDNVISFVYLDPSESPLSGTKPEDGLAALTVSDLTPHGFDLSWKLKARGVYDSLTVEYKDTQGLWDVRDVQLPGDAAGSRVKGLRASTEYQIKLYGITSSQRSALAEAIAVTGIRIFDIYQTFSPAASPFKRLLRSDRVYDACWRLTY